MRGCWPGHNDCHYNDLITGQELEEKTKVDAEVAVGCWTNWYDHRLWPTLRSAAPVLTPGCAGLWPGMCQYTSVRSRDNMWDSECSDHSSDNIIINTLLDQFYKHKGMINRTKCFSIKNIHNSRTQNIKICSHILINLKHKLSRTDVLWVYQTLQVIVWYLSVCVVYEFVITAIIMIIEDCSQT